MKGEDLVGVEVGSGGVNKFDAGIVAEDVDEAVGVGGETAGERWEVREGFGERNF